MCGIAGAFALDTSFRVTGAYLERLRDSMLHRGPDGAGTWVSEDGRVGLAHRRLAIVDLTDAAAQPMCNEDGAVWVSFNGEIYNHAEIRRELEAMGEHRWKTDHSDTEVILHAFEQWGIDCIQKFRGMFAFALWDAKSRELWLVRDRIGIKPLYYSFHHGRLVFASEIKALLQDPDQIREVSEEGLYHYLSFLTTPAPLTLFEGIRKLPCGTWLRVRESGSVQVRRYWDVLDHIDPLRNRSDDDIAEELLSELRHAVKLRKMSDVPVGVFLSGGIDSSTNAALFSEGEVGPVRTFSIGYDGNYPSYPSELPFARRVAELVGAEHHERILNLNDLLSFLPRMVQLQDEPIGDPVCVPLYYVAQLARQAGVIVCQVGEGSDELFWGYPSWKVKLRLQQLDDLPVPRFLKRLGAAGLYLFGKSNSYPAELLRRGISGRPIFWGGAESFTDFEKRALLSSRLRTRFAGFSSWEAIEPIHNRFLEKAWEPTHLNWMTYLDLNLRLPELLLMRVDKMSMGVSLEARVPFLDHKFVELAMSVPTSVKTRGGQLKSILKKAVRGVIPDEIIERKKQGFGVPISEWFMGHLGAYGRRVLQEFCGKTDFFHPAAVEELFRPRPGTQAWTLLNLALWWNEYVQSNSISAASEPVAELGPAIGSSAWQEDFSSAS